MNATMTFAAKLLADCMIATGASPEQASRAAAVVVSVAVAADLIPQAHLDAWELAAKVYHLRVGMSNADIAVRLEIGKRWVIKSNNRHGNRMRAALKAMPHVEKGA